MKRCIIRFTPNALLELFGLPRGAELESLARDPLDPERFRVKVRGAGPEVPDGSLMRDTLITVHTRQDADGTRWFRCEPQHPQGDAAVSPATERLFAALDRSQR